MSLLSRKWCSIIYCLILLVIRRVDGDAIEAHECIKGGDDIEDDEHEFMRLRNRMLHGVTKLDKTEGAMIMIEKEPVAPRSKKEEDVQTKDDEEEEEGNDGE